MNALETTSEFSWVGPSHFVSGRSRTEHYRSFTNGQLTVSLDDFVLIRNEDSQKPESFDFCHVAKVIDLYDSDSADMQYCCEVQWFLRLFDLNPKLQKQIEDPDYYQELILDQTQKWHKHIDAETIFQRCKVVLLELDVPPEMIFTSMDKYRLYFCRYAFTKYGLEPVKLHSSPEKKMVTQEHSQLRSIDKSRITRRENLLKCLTKNDPSSQINNLENGCEDPTSFLDLNNVPKPVQSEKMSSHTNHNKSLQETEIERLLDEPARSVIHPTPVKQFYSSEKKPPCSVSINAQSVQKKLFSDHSKENNPAKENGQSNLGRKKKHEKLNDKKTPDHLDEKEEENQQLLASQFKTTRSGRKARKVCFDPDKFNEKFHLGKKEEESQQSLGSQFKVTRSGRKVRRVCYDPDRFNRKDAVNVHDKRNKDNEKMSNTHFTRSGQKGERSDNTDKLNRNQELHQPGQEKRVNQKLANIHRKGSWSEQRARRVPENRNGTKEPNDSEEKEEDILKLTDVLFNVTRSGRKVKSINYYDIQNYHPLTQICDKRSKTTIKKLYASDTDLESSDTDNFEDSNLSDSSDESEIELSPLKKSFRTPTSGNTDKKKVSTKHRKSTITGSIVRVRKTQCDTPRTPLEKARANLHVCAVPDSLPCRDNEFSEIFNFVESKLLEEQGGCMYICGVPGTGKTATVNEVIRTLEESRDSGHLPNFSFVEINALRLTNPHQIYVHLLKELKDISRTAEQALDLVNRHFEEGHQKRMVVLMLDELDMLWTKRQDVLYNLFHWPLLPRSRLVILAIANTMDLPERLLAKRVASRLGLTRTAFMPYSHQQLQKIVMSRIEGLAAFNPDAVQLVARKVASVSGDARRALDICRRATELVKEEEEDNKKKSIYLVNMKHVDAAIQEMFSSPKISAIRYASVQEKLFLQAIVGDFASTGVEETCFNSVAKQHIALCRLEGVQVLTYSQMFSLCTRLYDMRLVILENGKADIFKRIKLNLSVDDVTYALKDNKL